MTRPAHLLVLTLVASLALAAPASAAEELWTAPGADPLNAVCVAVAPCTLDQAVTQADPDDTIVLTTGGAYQPATPITLTGTKLTGVVGEDRPVIAAPAWHPGPVLTLTGGATIAHTQILSDATADPALVLDDAAAERIVVGAAGDAVRLAATTTPSVIRNSLLRSDTRALHTVDHDAGGTAVVRNVTALAGDTAVRCATTTGTTQIVNAVVRGTAFDVDARGAAVCDTDHSSLRPALSPSAGTKAPLAAEPKLDPGTAVPLAGSPLIDAGVTGAADGTLDLGGAARTQGKATDVGAFETTPVAPGPQPQPERRPETTPSPNASDTAVQATTKPQGEPVVPALPAAAPPALGRTVLVEASPGVLVRLPGTNRFVALTDAASIPVGTVVDTRKGPVTLETALPGGKVQTGTFEGGMFEIRQSRAGRGMTDIVLAGGNFGVCPRRTAVRRTGIVARAAARKPKAIRKLWAKDKGGRFRTHGSNSIATVRGTRWLTEDRCDGTYTKVTSGTVDVKDRRTGKVTRVRAGRSVLVRASR